MSVLSYRETIASIWGILSCFILYHSSWVKPAALRQPCREARVSELEARSPFHLSLEVTVVYSSSLLKDPEPELPG